uniref:YadA C-terminal domain-containing protein n=1 Tax=uncultured Sphingomonas sp. TaxID=158754 RepID=UPI0035CAE352
MAALFEDLAPRGARLRTGRAHQAIWSRMICGAATIASCTSTAILPAPAAAQVRFGSQGIEGFSAVCLDDGELALPEDNDCKTGLVGSDFDTVQGIYTGTADNHAFLSANGDAQFESQVDFYKNTNFHGPVTFSGPVNLQGSTLNTTTITNGGQLTTGGIHVTSGSQFDGPAIFSSVNSQFLFTGSAQTIQLTATGAARLLGGATITSGLNVTGGTTSDSVTATTALTAAAGATVDMGGNRVQNVGAPVAGSDAANKDYVDTAVGGVQGNVAVLTTQVANHETRITTVETTNAVQDTRLGAVENTDTVQNGRLAAVETKDAGQDARMAAIESVNATQSQQIGTLQDQVGGLQTSVNGLRRDIRAANAGIASAVALGGTMIVPDSTLSVSFNLATYRGQQGFSGAVVGRVSPKVYVNAGVGGSTVRGSTAGRVGISFGL